MDFNKRSLKLCPSPMSNEILRNVNSNICSMMIAKKKYSNLNIVITKVEIKKIIIIIKVWHQHVIPWISLAIHPYWSSFVKSLQNSTQCLYRADESKFFQAGQVKESTGECCLWVCPYFSSSSQHVLFILLAWFVRLEVSGHTAAVLKNFNLKNQIH